MLPLKQSYDNVPPCREKSAVSPGTARSGRRIIRKYRAVCAYHSVPPDKICKEAKNKRTTISNDTLIVIQFLIKVDKHPYGCISPLIFSQILSVSLSIGFSFLETKR